MVTSASPRVSVMVPCYQAADTLRFALASMAAQTLTDWECVCVDDGSRDETWSILRQASERDCRFVVHRFERNRGRGAARQFLLEKARGELLAFLDADDWTFPERLEREAERLAQDPYIAAVGAPMVIFDEDDAPVGLSAPSVHGGGTVDVFDRPRPPTLNFPASMIRTDRARAVGFDPRFLRSQDSDMLIRALLGRRYAVLTDPVYAYRKAAMTLDKTLDGYRFRIRSHLRHVRRFPLTVGTTVAKTAAKMALYRLAGVVGREGRLLDQRYAPVGAAHANAYEEARTAVRGAHERLWHAH